LNGWLQVRRSLALRRVDVAMPKRIKALLVEDCRTIAIFLTHALARGGFDVFVAADGPAGLEIAKREQPRVVITDINLPGMNGLDLIRALRATPGTRDAAIVGVSADGIQLLARAAGADDFIVKPIDPQLLVDRVRALLDRAAVR
jgi:DNA-binding response OmpR family regulator